MKSCVQLWPLIMVCSYGVYNRYLMPLRITLFRMPTPRPQLSFPVPIVSAIIERQCDGQTEGLVQTRWKSSKDPKYSGALDDYLQLNLRPPRTRTAAPG